MTEPIIESKEEIIEYLDNILRDITGAQSVIMNEKISNYFKWLRDELRQIIRMVNEL